MIADVSIGQRHHQLVQVDPRQIEHAQQPRTRGSDPTKPPRHSHRGQIRRHRYADKRRKDAAPRRVERDMSGRWPSQRVAWQCPAEWWL